MKFLGFHTTFIFFVIIFSSITFSQRTSEFEKATQHLHEKGEVYFRFPLSSLHRIETITKKISIDNVMGHEVYAYANKDEFFDFIQLNLHYEVLTHPGDLLENPAMSDYSNRDDFEEWNKYPTYDGFLKIMESFEAQYPDYCKIIEIGTTNKGRKLLAAKVSDKVNTDEAEPRFWYSSTMHGDEATNYVGLLHLIDYLLKNKENDQLVKTIIENIEMWIMPLENPDGTYKGGDNSVKGATRGNANNVDLNRNYPKLPSGSGNFQKETKAMMKFYDTKKFVMGANYHGGAELLNYPFDTWKSNKKKHADHTWWKHVCEIYQSFATYMTVTHGGDWYVVDGSRQDYMNYFQLSREVTIEISKTKLVSESQLIPYWNKNYEGMLHLALECLNGINGIITDGKTGKPVNKVKVVIDGHDHDSSHVYSKDPHGDYYRPIIKGDYSATFSKPGYNSRTIKDIKVVNGKASKINVTLYPEGSGLQKGNKTVSQYSLSIIPHNNGIKITVHGSVVMPSMQMLANIYDLRGKQIHSLPINRGTVVWNKRNNSNRILGSGFYLLQLETASQDVLATTVFQCR